MKMIYWPWSSYTILMVYCHPSHAMDILLKVKVTLWLFNIAMENGPFIDGLPIKNGGFFHGYLK